MAQAVRRRKQGTISFSSNNKVSEGISRGMVYRELYLHLTGTLDCVAASNTQAATKRGDEWALVKRIDVIANGTDVIKSISGTTLRILNSLMYGVPPRVSVELGNGTADPGFNSVLVLPFWMPKAVQPMDTALDSRQLSSLNIEITWGDAQDLNALADGFVTNPTVKLSSLESFNVKGPFSQFRVWEIEKEVTANNSRFQVQLPVGGIYRGVLINTTDDDNDVATVLQNFKLVSGSTVFADVDGFPFREVEQMRSGFHRPFDGTKYLDNFIGDANNFEGWYMYDHVTLGLLSESIDTLGFSEFTLECDVVTGSGNTKLRVIPLEIVPVRGGPVAG